MRRQPDNPRNGPSDPVRDRLVMALGRQGLLSSGLTQILNSGKWRPTQHYTKTEANPAFMWVTYERRRSKLQQVDGVSRSTTRFSACERFCGGSTVWNRFRHWRRWVTS